MKMPSIFYKVAGFICLFVVIACTNVFGQAVTTVPYTCGFENSTENSKWSLNQPSPSSIVNKWFVGTATKRSGASSMFVGNGWYTTDYSGCCPSYSMGLCYDDRYWNRTLTLAWREFDLPAGTYDLSFYWKCGGGYTDHFSDEMAVAWVDATTNVRSMGGNGVYIPSWLNPALISFGGKTELSNSPYTWRKASAQITSTGVPMKLVFIWKNDAPYEMNPAVSIDDIELTGCPTPMNFNATIAGGTASLSWTSSESSFDVEYGLKGGTMTTVAVSGKTHTISGLSDGEYVFKVRTRCDAITTSGWVEKEVVYGYPHADFEYSLDTTTCDNTITFTNKSGVKVGSVIKPQDCETYDWDFDNGQTSTEKNPTMAFPVPGTYEVTLVAGLESKALTDTMTVSITVTKPTRRATIKGNACEGEDYVWLGNTYNYSVAGLQTIVDTVHNALTCDTIYTLELMVHAHVSTNLTMRHCEGDPLTWGGHTYNFTAGQHTIRDTLSTSVGCDSVLVMSVDVIPPTLITEKDTVCKGGNFTWHGKVINTSTVGDYVHYDSLKTFIGCDSVHRLDLHINIPVVKQYTHTLCSGDTYVWRGKDLSAMPVGVHEVYDSLVAPTGCDDIHRLTLTVNSKYHFAEARTICDGERLVWRSVNQVYPVGEHTLFDSLVSSLGCDSVYELKLLVAPKYMFAETHSLCQNESYVWRGQVISTNVAGAFTHEERHKSVLGCDSVYQLALTVNPVYEYDITKAVCAGESFVWNGNTYSYEPGTHTLLDTLTTVNGCDSIFDITINVFGKDSTLTIDTICSDESYDWNGQTINTSGIYTYIEKNTQGCDVHYYELSVQVRQALEMSFDVVDFKACGDDDFISVGYTIENGRATDYSVEYSQLAKDEDFVDKIKEAIVSGEPVKLVIPVPTDTTREYVLPGDYEAKVVFHNDECGDVEQVVKFTIQYPSWVIAQRWNDVLAVKNEEYNGGFEFAEYQWYKNNQPIEGETSSILYADVEPLDITAEYSVLLTRVDDGVEEMTCVIVPERYASEDLGEVRFDIDVTGKTIHSTLSGEMRLYAANGILLKTQMFGKGNTEIEIPEVSGVYIINVVLENGEVRNEKIAIR